MYLYESVCIRNILLYDPPLEPSLSGAPLRLSVRLSRPMPSIDLKSESGRTSNLVEIMPNTSNLGSKCQLRSKCQRSRSLEQKWHNLWKSRLWKTIVFRAYLREKWIDSTDIIEYISPVKMRRFAIFVCHILHTAFVRSVLECRRMLTSYGEVTLYTSEWWSTFKIKRSILRSLGTKMWKSFLRLFSIKRSDLHQSNTKMIFTRRPIVKCISPAET